MGRPWSKDINSRVVGTIVFSLSKALLGESRSMGVFVRGRFSELVGLLNRVPGRGCIEEFVRLSGHKCI